MRGYPGRFAIPWVEFNVYLALHILRSCLTVGGPSNGKFQKYQKLRIFLFL